MSASESYEMLFPSLIYKHTNKNQFDIDGSVRLYLFILETQLFDIDCVINL